MNSSWVSLTAEILDVRAAEIEHLVYTRPFVQLGGTSLRAMELVAIAEERLRYRLDIGALLGPASLASVIGAARPVRQSLDVDAARDLEEGAELRTASTLQTAMLLGEQLHGGIAFHLLFSADIRGRVERARLLTALNCVTYRHEALRTVFSRAADGVPRRRVLRSWAPRLIEQSLPPRAHNEPVAAVHALLEAATVPLLRPFERPPVVFVWTRIGDERSVLSVVIHHTIADGWSIGLLWREIAAAYDDRLDDGPAPSQDRLIALETADGTRRALSERLTDLADAPTVVELPSDLTRSPDAARAGARLIFGLNDITHRSCDEHVAATGLTRNAVLLATWALVVARRAAVHEVLIGLVAMNRPDADALRVIGPCTTVLPTRCPVSDTESSGEYQHRVASAMRAALEDTAVPFEHVVAGLESCGGGNARSPLVQIGFAAHDELVPASLRTANMTLELHEGHCGGALLDAVLYVQRWAEGPRLALEYRNDVLRPDEAAELALEFDHTLADLARAPSRPLAEIRSLTECGRRQLMDLGTGPATDTSTGLWQLIENRAAHCLDKTAVRDGNSSGILTYRSLMQAVEAQSAALVSVGVKRGDCVGLAVGRSIGEIISILSLIRMGASYMGIEPDLPEALAKRMLDIAAVCVVIGDPEHLAGLGAALQGRTAITITDPQRPTGGAYVEPAPADLSRVAYIAFTSGSTGIPKGTCVPHRAIVRLVNDPAYLRAGACDRFLRLAPLGFDASTLEIFAPLAAGGCIEIYRDRHVSPSAFAEFVTSRRLTGLWLTAGLFRLVADYRPDAFTGVRQLLTGGDVVPPEQVRRVLQVCPGLRISNGYGPTENTTFTTVHHLDDPVEVEDPIPIGRPIQGTGVAVLDGTGRMVPRGGIGELYVYGDGLALGYAGMPEETEASFGYFSPEIEERLYRTGDLVRWDAEGNLRFIGRRDRQVKVRGFRIELDAVARTLRDHPAVHDAIVVASASSPAEHRLVAGLVAPGSGREIVEEVRALATRRLPGHEIPALWAVVEELPVTANGKVDIAALEELAGGRPAGANQATAPQVSADALEQVIAGVWSKVIGTRRFGVHDRFFDVGGDSLQMLRAAASLGRSLPGHEITVQELFAYPTISGLADRLRAQARDDGE